MRGIMRSKRRSTSNILHFINPSLSVGERVLWRGIMRSKRRSTSNILHFINPSLSVGERVLWRGLCAVKDEVQAIFCILLILLYRLEKGFCGEGYAQ